MLKWKGSLKRPVWKLLVLRLGTDLATVEVKLPCWGIDNVIVWHQCPYLRNAHKWVHQREGAPSHQCLCPWRGAPFPPFPLFWGGGGVRCVCAFNFVTAKYAGDGFWVLYVFWGVGLVGGVYGV